MQPMHYARKCELAAILAGVLSVMTSIDATAQAPAPAAPPPAVAPAPAAPPPTAAPAPAAPPPVAAPAPEAPPPVAQPGVYVPPSQGTPPPPPPSSWSTQPPAARERPNLLVGYEIALPVTDLNDFISTASFRGFELGALWPVYRGLYVGSVFNYHLFYEEQGNRTYQLQNGALTGNLYRYTKNWTVAAAARYMFLEPDSLARPFVGLRMGVAFVTSATLVSDLTFYDTPTGFALAPEAGVLLRLASFMHASLSLRYDYSTASAGDLDKISYMAYQIGLVFRSGK